jgi:hypothetical protein
LSHSTIRQQYQMCLTMNIDIPSIVKHIAERVRSQVVFFDLLVQYINHHFPPSTPSAEGFDD